MHYLIYFKVHQKIDTSFLISFSDFLVAVESGNVSEVNIKGNNVEGFFEDGKPFNTYSPNYPNLVEKLSENGVRINAVPE